MQHFRRYVNAEQVDIYRPEEPAEIAGFFEFVNKDNLFGLDVETTAISDAGVFSKDARLRLVQIASRDEAWVLDVSTEIFRKAVSWFMIKTAKNVVSHTVYDVLWTRREFDINLGTRSFDTHVLACLIWPGERTDHTLKGLCTEHVDGGLRDAETALDARFKALAPSVPVLDADGQPVLRKDGKPRSRKLTGKALKEWAWDNIPADDEAYVVYAGLDAIYVRRLWDALLPMCEEFPNMTLRSLQERRWMTDLQWRGCLVDSEHTAGQLFELSNQYDAAAARLEAAFGFPARSNKRGEWLEAHGLKVDANKRTPTGGIRMQADDIIEYAAKYADHPTLGPVLRDMLVLSSTSNKISNLRITLSSRDENGFVHPSYNILHAATGRMSVTKPAMQTLSKRDMRLRQCYVARPGYVFVTADLDQIEVVLAAGYSGDPAMRKVVLDGVSMHDMTAEAAFGSGFTYDQRAVSKTVNFAAQYLAGWRKISAQTGIDPVLCKRLRDAYHQVNAVYIQYAIDLMDSEVIVTDWGRRLPRDEVKPYSNINKLIQGSGRDYLGDCIIKLYELGFGEYLFALIHDEAILEVPVEMADAAVDALNKAMRGTFRGLPINADASILGPRWGGPIDGE